MDGLTPADIEELDVAVRAWAVPDYLRHIPPKPAQGDGPAPGRYVDPGPSDWSLVFDCETVTDRPSQRLRIGIWQTRKGTRLRDDGVFYDPDVLSVEEVVTVERYTTDRGMRALSVEAFIEEVFLRVAWRRRGLVIGHNLPFDLSRLAIEERPPQGKDKSMRGGFSLRLSADPNKPRVQVKKINAGGAFIRLTLPGGESPEARNRRHGGRSTDHHGYFLDTATLGSALVGEKTLKGLAKTLRTEHQKDDADHGETLDEAYLDYCHNDVQVTWECCAALRGYYQRFGLSLPAWKIYSEAGVGKAHLEAMGLRKWLKSDHGFPDWLIATINETYLGGRTECAIRRTPVPGVYVDFTSQYPTVFSLMGLWPYLTAERIAWREIPADEVQRRLDAVTVDDVLDPVLWEGLAVICRVAPDGDRLPTRAKYRASRRATKAAKRSRAYNVATPYRSGGPEQHYTLADCVASKLMTGKAPRVTRAWAFEPVGQQPNLAPIDIAGEAKYRLGPRCDDFIRRLVELRADAKTKAKDAIALGDEASTRWWDAVARAMKVTANAIAYGSAIEMNPIEHRKPVWVTVHLPDGDSYRTRVPRSEQPGGWFNPLVATLVAGGGRLLLATAMRLVADAGGHYAFCDTDSLFIVATKDGGTAPPLAADDAGVRPEADSEAQHLPALSWDDVRGIVTRFVALNPYDPLSVRGSILKIEDDNLDPETDRMLLDRREALRPLHPQP